MQQVTEKFIEKSLKKLPVEGLDFMIAVEKKDGVLFCLKFLKAYRRANNLYKDESKKAYKYIALAALFGIISGLLSNRHTYLGLFFMMLFALSLILFSLSFPKKAAYHISRKNDILEKVGKAISGISIAIEDGSKRAIKQHIYSINAVTYLVEEERANLLLGGYHDDTKKITFLTFFLHVLESHKASLLKSSKKGIEESKNEINKLISEISLLAWNYYDEDWDSGVSRCQKIGVAIPEEVKNIVEKIFEALCGFSKNAKVVTTAVSLVISIPITIMLGYLLYFLNGAVVDKGIRWYLAYGSPETFIITLGAVFVFFLITLPKVEPFSFFEKK